MRDSYRNVDPQDVISRLREEKSELEQQLAKAIRDRDTHKCPSRFSNPFQNWEFDGLAVGTYAMMAIVFVGTGLAVYFALRTPTLQSGIITNKHMYESYNTTSFMTVGKTIVPVITHHEARWWVIVCDEGQCEDVDMSEGGWSEAQAGQHMCVRDCNSTARN